MVDTWTEPADRGRSWIAADLTPDVWRTNWKPWAPRRELNRRSLFAGGKTKCAFILRAPRRLFQPSYLRKTHRLQHQTKAFTDHNQSWSVSFSIRHPIRCDASRGFQWRYAIHKDTDDRLYDDPRGLDCIIIHREIASFLWCGNSLFRRTNSIVDILS